MSPNQVTYLSLNVFGSREVTNPVQLNVNYGGGSWREAVSYFLTTANGGHTVSSMVGTPNVSGSTVSALFHNAALTNLPSGRPLWWYGEEQLIQNPPEGQLQGGGFAAAGCPVPAAGYSSVDLPNWSATDLVSLP